MKKISLPSGAELGFGVVDFSTAKTLWQVVLEEGKGLTINSKDEMDVNLLKNIIFTIGSSKKFEEAVWECMKKCTYNSLKIDEQTFEPIEARDDYFTVIYEVTKETLAPFTKSLYAKFSPMLKELLKSLA